MERTEGGAERGERVRALDPAAAESDARRAWCCAGPAAAMADDDDAAEDAADKAATDPDPELGGVEGTERERPTGAKDEPPAAGREGMLIGALMPCATAEGQSSTGDCCWEDEEEEEEDDCAWACCCCEDSAAATTGASWAELLSCCALLVGMSVGPGTLCSTDATLLRGEARGAALLPLLVQSAAEAGTVAPPVLEDTLVGLVEGGVPVDEDEEEEAEACSSGEDDDTERCDEGAG